MTIEIMLELTPQEHALKGIKFEGEYFRYCEGLRVYVPMGVLLGKMAPPEAERRRQGLVNTQALGAFWNWPANYIIMNLPPLYMDHLCPGTYGQTVEDPMMIALDPNSLEIDGRVLPDLSNEFPYKRRAKPKTDLAHSLVSIRA